MAVRLGDLRVWLFNGQWRWETEVWVDGVRKVLRGAQPSHAETMADYEAQLANLKEKA